ncbi:endonuclease NucS [Methanobacterium oryzae]|uniref:endonuclease NucS n=1 Tax=Methanobacterium oryzae TaxID=69540 RepID=UPI003D24EA79
MIIKVKENPETQEFLDFINEALSKRAFVIIVACCSIEYRGRATSRLGSGDRTILIKADGSFLVHQDHNLEPVNWQPPNCKFTTKIEDDKVHILGIRRNPNESLEIQINKSYLASYHIGEDSKTLKLAGYEEDMREMIFKNPELIENGFRVTSREYSVSSGFIDIMGKDKTGNLVVIELKSRRAGVNAVKQLKRYFDDFSDHKKFVRGILVAPSITEDALELLEEFQMEFIALEPPKDIIGSKNLTLDFFKAY